MRPASCSANAAQSATPGLARNFAQRDYIGRMRDNRFEDCLTTLAAAMLDIPGESSRTVLIAESAASSSARLSGPDWDRRWALRRSMAARSSAAQVSECSRIRASVKTTI